MNLPSNTSASDQHTVLLVGDNPENISRYKDMILDESAELTLRFESSISSAIDEIVAIRPVMVLIDLPIAGMDINQTLSTIYDFALDVPVVVLTGSDAGDMGLLAVQVGAQDFLDRDRINGSVLIRVIRYGIERHRMVQELDRARQQQMELMDQFLSHASHELRSPLTTIHQFVSILKDGIAGNCNEDQKEYLEIIMRNVLELRGMINDLLDVTRAGNGKLTINREKGSIVQLIAETIESYATRASAKNITLTWSPNEFIYPLYADPKRIRQVLNNLLENALKFTPEGGRVSISAMNDPLRAGCVRVTVKDSGCGISRSGCQHIFGRLYQEPNRTEASRKGLGIGLFICKELITQHGGFIWVESELGVGSEFNFTVPADPFRAMLQPFLQQNSGNAGIISVSLTSNSEDISESTRRMLRQAIETAIVPSDEMLIPRIGYAAHREVCMVVASGTDLNVTASSVESHLKHHFSMPDSYSLLVTPTVERIHADCTEAVIAESLKRSIYASSINFTGVGSNSCLQKS
ncbi:MAG: ATP-binding protein [Chthonomonadales bacterium]